MSDTEHSTQVAESGISCIFTRYAMTTSAARLLVVGVAIQIAAVLLAYFASFIGGPPAGSDMEWYQHMLRPSALAGLISSVINVAGWAMVIFACGKVVAESVKGCSR